jgi:hypothetical protein
LRKSRKRKRCDQQNDEREAARLQHARDCTRYTVATSIFRRRSRWEGKKFSAAVALSS